MKNHRLAVCILTILLTLSVTSCIDDTKKFTMKAYFIMEESPLDQEAFEEAVDLIKTARKSGRDEPWLYIATSLATMQQGYRIGSWYNIKSFEEGAIDKAQELGKWAVKLGQNESQAYAHLARIYIIKKDYKKAWGLLNKAHQLDNDNFYPWFYKALIHYYMKSYDDATYHLDEAESRISHGYQKKLVTRQRINIARELGDKVLAERMYKKNIKDFPENPYMYGNYANFLLKNKRYQESITYYEKAIAIKPYKHALKESRGQPA